MMEERSDGILLRPLGPATEKLSWLDTAREMAKAEESWNEWDVTSSDGLDDIPWEQKRPRAAEGKASYHVRKSGKNPHEAL